MNGRTFPTTAEEARYRREEPRLDYLKLERGARVLLSLQCGPSAGFAAKGGKRNRRTIHSVVRRTSSVSATPRPSKSARYMAPTAAHDSKRSGEDEADSRAAGSRIGNCKSGA